MLQNIKDPLDATNKLMEHELELLEGVPAYVYRGPIKTVRDAEPLA